MDTVGIGELAKLVEEASKFSAEKEYQKEIESEKRWQRKALTTEQLEDIKREVTEEYQPTFRVMAKNRIVTFHDGKAFVESNLPRNIESILLTTVEGSSRGIAVSMSARKKAECNAIISGNDSDWVASSSDKVERAFGDRKNKNWLLNDSPLRLVLIYGSALIVSIRVFLSLAPIIPNGYALWTLISALFGFVIMTFLVSKAIDWMFPWIEFGFGNDTSRSQAKTFLLGVIGAILATIVVSFLI